MLLETHLRIGVELAPPAARTPLQPPNFAGDIIHSTYITRPVPARKGTLPDVWGSYPDHAGEYGGGSDPPK